MYVLRFTSGKFYTHFQRNFQACNVKKIFSETGFYVTPKKQPFLRWLTVVARNFIKSEHHILVWKAFLLLLLCRCIGLLFGNRSTGGEFAMSSHSKVFRFTHPHVVGFAEDYFFLLWRADLKYLDWLWNLQDTCGRGLIPFCCCCGCGCCSCCCFAPFVYPIEIVIKLFCICVLSRRIDTIIMAATMNPKPKNLKLNITLKFRNLKVGKRNRL